MYNKKRITALALAGLMGTLAFFPPINAWAAYNKVNGTYQMLDGTSIQGVHARGIDVSHWKQTIDWNAVAADDVQFAMLGTRYKGEVDPYFHANAANAVNAGLDIGVYIYSYATNTAMAEAEADFVLNLIKDYPISYPVAFDIEDSVQSTLSPQEVSAIINAFCKKIEDAGYYPMLYANDYWLANKIDMSQVHYDVWVARYEIKHSFSNPAMWQATSTGSVNGVNGNVDINFQYKDFSPVIPANTWRTIGGISYYYQNYAMQKDTWIHDGQNSYYMTSDGTAHKGWKTDSTGTYLLDSSDGRMSTGWKQVDDSWYYFNTAGSIGTMATDWVNDNGTWYYMDKDGKMQTGWKDLNGSRYYLKSDGSMAVGWRNLDNSWYYFTPSGTMSTGWINLDNNWYYLSDDGKMTTGWIKPDNNYYLLGSDGKMVTGWHQENGQTYYLSENTGKMTVGWREMSDGWRYFNESGYMQTGPLNLNGQLYYLDPSNGAMAVNTSVTIDGIVYQAGADGVLHAAEVSNGSNTGQMEPEAGNKTDDANQSPTQGNLNPDNSTGEKGPGL